MALQINLLSSTWSWVLVAAQESLVRHRFRLWPTQRALFHSPVTLVCFVNNRADNQLPNNSIQTSKYTNLNFIFKNLFEQFSKIANIYFFVTPVLHTWACLMIAQLSLFPVPWRTRPNAVTAMLQKMDRRGLYHCFTNKSLKVVYGRKKN